MTTTHNCVNNTKLNDFYGIKAVKFFEFLKHFVPQRNFPECHSAEQRLEAILYYSGVTNIDFYNKVRDEI